VERKVFLLCGTTAVVVDYGQPQCSKHCPEKEVAPFGPTV